MRRVAVRACGGPDAAWLLQADAGSRRAGVLACCGRCQGVGSLARGARLSGRYTRATEGRDRESALLTSDWQGWVDGLSSLQRTSAERGRLRAFGGASGNAGSGGGPELREVLQFEDGCRVGRRGLFQVVCGFLEPGAGGVCVQGGFVQGGDAAAVGVDGVSAF